MSSSLCIERIVESLLKAEQSGEKAATEQEGTAPLAVTSVAGAERYFQLCATVCNLLPDASAKRAELRRLIHIWEQELVTCLHQESSSVNSSHHTDPNPSFPCATDVSNSLMKTLPHTSPALPLLLSQLITIFTLLHQLQSHPRRSGGDENGTSGSTALEDDGISHKPTTFSTTLSERKQELRELLDCNKRWNTVLFTLLQCQYRYQQEGGTGTGGGPASSFATASAAATATKASAPVNVSLSSAQRWGQLLSEPSASTTSQPSSILACCVLHGIALLAVSETTGRQGWVEIEMEGGQFHEKVTTRTNNNNINNNNNNNLHTNTEEAELETLLQSQQRVWVEQSLLTVYYAGLTAAEQQRVKVSEVGRCDKKMDGVTSWIEVKACCTRVPEPPQYEMTVATATDILTEITRRLTQDRPIGNHSAFSVALSPSLPDDDDDEEEEEERKDNDHREKSIDQKKQKPKSKTRAERRAAGNGAQAGGAPGEPTAAGTTTRSREDGAKKAKESRTPIENKASSCPTANTTTTMKKTDEKKDAVETPVEVRQARLAVRIIAGILNCLQRGSSRPEATSNNSRCPPGGPTSLLSTGSGGGLHGGSDNSNTDGAPLRSMPLSEKMVLARRILLPLLLSFSSSPTAAAAMRGIEANVLLPLLTALANQGGEACLEEVVVLTAALFDFLFRPSSSEAEGGATVGESLPMTDAAAVDFRYTPFLWDTLWRALQYAIRGGVGGGGGNQSSRSADVGSEGSATGGLTDDTTSRNPLSNTNQNTTTTTSSTNNNGGAFLDAGRQINMQLRVCYLLKRLVHWTSMTHPKPRRGARVSDPATVAAETSDGDPTTTTTAAAVSTATAVTLFHPLFEWNPQRSPQAWDDFFLVMETTNEFNLHIILPVLKRLDALVEVNLKDRLSMDLSSSGAAEASPSSLTSLHPQWIELLLLKLLKHPNTAVRKVILRRMWHDWPQFSQQQQPQKPTSIRAPHQTSPSSCSSSRLACSPVWYTGALSMPFLFYDVFLTCADPRLCSDLDRLPVSATFLEMRAFEWEEVPASPASEPIAASVDRLYTHLFCERLRDGPAQRATALLLLLDAVQAQQSRFALSLFARLFAAVSVALYEEACQADEEKTRRLAQCSVDMILDARNLDRFLHVFDENMPFWLEVRVSAILFTGLLHLALIRPEACRESAGFWRLLCHCGPLACSGGKITSRVEGAGQVVGPATGAGQETCFLTQYLRTLSQQRRPCAWGPGESPTTCGPGSAMNGSFLHRLLGVSTLLARTRALLRRAGSGDATGFPTFEDTTAAATSTATAASPSSFRTIVVAVKEHFFLIGALARRGEAVACRTNTDTTEATRSHEDDEEDEVWGVLQSLADLILEELEGNLNRPYGSPHSLFACLVAFIEFQQSLGVTIRYSGAESPPRSAAVRPSSVPLPLASACSFFSPSRLCALISRLETEALGTLESIYAWYRDKADMQAPALHNVLPEDGDSKSAFWVQLEAWEALVVAISSARSLLVHHHYHHSAVRSGQTVRYTGEEGVEDPDVASSRKELFTKRLPALFALLVKINHKENNMPSSASQGRKDPNTAPQTKAILLHHTVKLLQSELAGILLCHTPPRTYSSSSITSCPAGPPSAGQHLPCYAEDAALDQQRWWQGEAGAIVLLQPLSSVLNAEELGIPANTTTVQAYIRILMDCLENSTLHHALVHQRHRYPQDNGNDRIGASEGEGSVHHGSPTATSNAFVPSSLSHILLTVLPSTVAWTDILTGLDRAVYNSIYAFCPLLTSQNSHKGISCCTASLARGKNEETDKSIANMSSITCVTSDDAAPSVTACPPSLATLLLELEEFALNQLETCWSLNLPCVYDILVWLCGLPFPSSLSELEEEEEPEEPEGPEETTGGGGEMAFPRLHRQAMLKSMMLHAMDVGAKQQTRLLSMVYGALRLCLPYNPTYVFSCLQRDMTVPVTIDRTASSNKKQKKGTPHSNNVKKNAGNNSSAAGGKGQSQRDVYYAAATVSLAVLQHYSIAMNNVHPPKGSEGPSSPTMDPCRKDTLFERRTLQRLRRWWEEGFRPLLLHWAVFYSAPRDAENESTQAVTESVLAKHWPESFRLRYPASVNLALLGRTLCVSTLLWFAAHHPTLMTLPDLSSIPPSSSVSSGAAEALTMELLDMNTLHPVLTSEPCMPNSETHRARMRVWQLLCALQPVLFSSSRENTTKTEREEQEKVATRVMEKVCSECVPLNNLGSVRRFIEVYCIRLLHTYPRLYRVIDRHLGNYRLRPQVMGTFILIAGHALLEYEERGPSGRCGLVASAEANRNKKGENEKPEAIDTVKKITDDDGNQGGGEEAFSVLFPRLLQQSTSHQHLLRIISHVAIYRICHARLARLGGLGDDPSAVLSPAVAQVFRYITDAEEHIKFREKHEAMLFYDTEKMASPRSLFCLQRKEANMVLCDAIPASMFERMQCMETEMTSLIGGRFAFERLRLRRVFGGDDVTSLLRRSFARFPFIPHTSHLTNCCTDYTTEAIEALWSDPLGEKLKEIELHSAAEDNVQRKTVSWWTSEVHNELHPRALGGGEQHQLRRHSMIMVASLLENPVNVAGLCRCGDIFAIEELVIAETAVFDHPHFVAVARSAERWVPWRAVPPVGLPAYLANMRTKGYTIVGIEQTTQSVSIDAFDFPLHCVLVLGSEGQGIPPPLIPLLDVCVEIPQYGLVRSLNVHVTGAVAMYEYTLQQIMSKTFA